MNTSSSSAIGVFDSGLGGLTVMKELIGRLPHENLIYVGDTARVPYGTKSPDTIRRYAMQIAFFLLQKKVKMIVIACNSASAVALKALQTLPIPVVGVIEPGSRAAVAASSSGRIGVIGTPATVASHAYQKAIHAKNKKSRVWEKACPLFVPLVEEGWIDSPVTTHVAKTYLTPLLKNKPDALVLGCTHYPLLKKTIQKVVGRAVTLIDSAEEITRDVEATLAEKRLLNPSKKKGLCAYYVTDNPAPFTDRGRTFLGEWIRPALRLRLEWL